MTTTGSEPMWALADALGVIPAPPSPHLAALLRDWWSVPRAFGCRHLDATTWWTVVAPDLRVWCPTCAGDRYADERRCFFCGKRVRPSRAEVLAVEMKSQVRVVALVHQHCADENTTKENRDA